MIKITKWMLAPALVTCFFLAGDTPTANAQFGSQIGNSCGAYGGGYSSGHRAAVNPYYGLRSSYPSIRAHYSSRYQSERMRYQDARYYDYRSTDFRRHGNHYDFGPGLYDFHRQGNRPRR